MKLNLWMVANRLYELEPELHIPENAPVTLKSARRVYADNCVYVFQHGEDVICDAGAEGGCIIFRDAKCDQIFEMIQFTFDFYEDWLEDVLLCVDKLDYQNLIYHCWNVFHNPILLLDQRSRLLTYSEQYKEVSINYDWDYLLNHGESAVSVIQFLMKIGKGEDFYTNSVAKIFKYPQNPYVQTEISVLIYNDLDVVGRLNILEYERTLNQGDCYLADMVVRFLRQILSQINNTNLLSRVLYPVLSKLLKAESVSETEKDYWKNITNWSSNQMFQVGILDVLSENRDIKSMLLICNLVQNAIPECFATELDGRIAFVYKMRDPDFPLTDLLQEIMQRFDLRLGYSLPFNEIETLHFYYDQAVFALEQGIKGNPSSKFHSFYDQAVEYLILSDTYEKKMRAIHPDIRRFKKVGGKRSEEQLKTLRTYLEQERSPGRSADILFIHKNTFLYRINKILNELSCDINDSYNRKFLLISIITIELLD